MVTATTHPPEPPTDPCSLVELQGQYLDLINRYVRRRVPDPRQAQSVVREVFQKASANPAQVQAHPLPWLIAAARRGCAGARRTHLSVLTEVPAPYPPGH
jgi:DNA-directed RNA polymerase specialized sigma24 family protein